MLRLWLNSRSRPKPRRSWNSLLVADDVRRVLIMGGYGNYRHVGDDAILAANLDGLRSRGSEVDLVVLSPDPDYTTRLYGVQSAAGLEAYLCECPLSIRLTVVRDIYLLLFFFLRYLLLLCNAQRLRAGRGLALLNPRGRSFMRILAASDVVLAVGGGYMASRWRYDQLYTKCAVCVLAKILGKSVIFSGQGIGPLDSWFDRKFVGWTLDHADVIAVRDHGISARLLREIGVDNPIIEESTDDAIGVASASEAQVTDYLDGIGIDHGRPLIAVCIHRWEGLEEVQVYLPGLLDELVESLSVQLLMLPMCFSKPMDDDRDTLRRLVERMRHQSAVQLFETEIGDELLVGIVRRCSFAITSRYHLAVFALANQIPCLAICSDQYYENKMRGILGQFNQEQFVIKSTESVDDFKKRIFELLRNYEKTRREISDRSIVLRKRPLPCVRYIGFAATTPTQFVAPWRAAFETYSVPRRMRRESHAYASVSVRNRGGETWYGETGMGRPLATLTYHWLRIDGSILVWDGQRTLLPHSVRPEELITLDMQLMAPKQEGKMILECDVCIEGVTWLAQAGSETIRVEVDVL